MVREGFYRNCDMNWVMRGERCWPHEEPGRAPEVEGGGSAKARRQKSAWCVRKMPGRPGGCDVKRGGEKPDEVEEAMGSRSKGDHKDI